MRQGLLLVSVSWLAACGGINNSMTRTVAESVTLGPEWKVFPIQPPLEVQRMSQKIRMQLADVTDWVKPHGSLRLRDGSTIDIEVELTDQTGRRHALVAASIGAYIGFGPASAEEGAGFARSRRFTEVRVRSSKPILAKQIEWYCWTEK